MQNLKVMFVIVALFGTMVSANAQRKVVKVYPKHGMVVTKIHKPKIVVHNRVNFHFAKGVWYRPQGRKYVVCAAPIGIKIRRLPRGNKVVYINGKKLYKYNGVWYKKRGRGYVVATV